MNPQKSPSLPPTGSPSIPWGSPALRQTSSFPPTNLNYNNINTPPHRPPMGMRPFGQGQGAGNISPYSRMPLYPSFRTPQPRQQSPNTPNRPWSDSRTQGRRGYQGNRGSHHNSPRDSPSMNPGGSDNILLYYHPDMLEDPWLDTPPRPVDYWKK